MHTIKYTEAHQLAEKKTECFSLGTFLMNDREAFHLARTTISSRNDLVYHRHDYAEIFWIKQGNGIHVINGSETRLVTGSLVMIRPDDTHTFRLSKDRNDLVVTNTAFHAENLDYFRSRYFAGSDSYFWVEGPLPFTIVLDNRQLNELSAIVDRLFSEPRDYLHLDYLMINIFRIISSGPAGNEHLPHWLSYALENFNSPEQFRNGTGDFVALAGRSADHVNRSLNRYLKQTLTDTVNKARLEYAARQLTLTNAAIKKISYDCGFSNISYFHRIFMNYYGITPGEYRRRNHKIF